MLEEIEEERRELLDLFFLIAILMIVTTIIASNLLVLLPGWAQLLLIGGLALVFVARLFYKPLFSTVPDRRFHLPLEFDREAGSFLVPMGTRDIANPVNDAYLRAVKGQIDDGVDPDQEVFLGDDPYVRDLVEYGILRVLSDVFRSGWSIRVEELDHGGRLTEIDDLESEIYGWGDVKDEFSDNRVISALEEEGDDGLSDLSIHLPPGTSVSRRSAMETEPDPSLAFENRYVTVRLVATGYRAGRGRLEEARMDPAELTGKMANLGQAAAMQQIQNQQRYAHAIIDIKAVIEPKRPFVLFPGATKRLQWAESVIENVQRACDYPIEHSMALGQ